MRWFGFAFLWCHAWLLVDIFVWPFPLSARLVIDGPLIGGVALIGLGSIIEPTRNKMRQVLWVCLVLASTLIVRWTFANLRVPFALATFGPGILILVWSLKRRSILGIASVVIFMTLVLLMPGTVNIAFLFGPWIAVILPMGASCQKFFGAVLGRRSSVACYIVATLGGVLLALAFQWAVSLAFDHVRIEPADIYWLNLLMTVPLLIWTSVAIQAFYYFEDRRI